ncbi:Uncharacterised protein [Mycobacteroides abscessus subsp. abscessus]|nr:Uncharacterised protein [Mycobacteroides abscessus subsp. abscessus]
MKLKLATRSLISLYSIKMKKKSIYPQLLRSTSMLSFSPTQRRQHPVVLDKFVDFKRIFNF